MKNNPSFKKAVFILILSHSGVCVWAQDLVIKRMELENEKVYLHYELRDSAQGRYYTINVYSSRDNYLNPIKNLKGDFGLEVPPGTARKIEINAKEEFGASFEGKLSFELRAKIYIPFIRMDRLNEKFKRGKPYEIYWSGGRPQNILNFELLKGEEKITTFSGIGNTGKYNLILPPDTKPGSNYRFRISDSKNKDEIVNTGTFTIVRKVPLLLKVVPMIMVGGAIYFILQPKPECEGCLEDFPTAPTEN